MYLTEKELIQKQKHSLFKLKNLINKGELELEDIASIFPGIVHLNSREDGSIYYMNYYGKNVIGYSIDDIQNLGIKLLEMHQSKEFLNVALPIINRKFVSSSSGKPISYTQGWKFNPKKEKYAFYASSKMIFDEYYYITFSQSFREINRIGCYSFLDSIYDQKNYQDYFEKYIKLTTREIQILELLVGGSTRIQISDSLFISIATVKTHCENIYRKLNTSNRLTLFKIYHAFQ